MPEARFVIEMAPVPPGDAATRGVVAEGPVGARVARRLRIFRYEVRRWREGVIPDADEAVDSPRHLSDDPGCGQRLLALVPQVPTRVWGRDELRAGEMWNSNSLISWLIARSGLDASRSSLQPADGLPAGGPGSSWRGARKRDTPQRSRGGCPFLRPPFVFGETNPKEER